MISYCTICGKRARVIVNNSRAYCDPCLIARLATLGNQDTIIMPITEAGPRTVLCDCYGCVNVAVTQTPTGYHLCNYHQYLQERYGKETL